MTTWYELSKQAKKLKYNIWLEFDYSVLLVTYRETLHIISKLRHYNLSQKSRHKNCMIRPSISPRSVLVHVPQERPDQPLLYTLHPPGSAHLVAMVMLPIAVPLTARVFRDTRDTIRSVTLVGPVVTWNM